MTSARRIASILLPIVLLAMGCSSSGNKEDELLDQLANLDKETIFERAEALYAEKEYQEAHEAFLKLSEAAPTPKSKAQCQAWAALSLNRQDQYEQAIELAKKIEIKPVSVHCQMEIMVGKNEV